MSSTDETAAPGTPHEQTLERLRAAVARAQAGEPTPGGRSAPSAPSGPPPPEAPDDDADPRAVARAVVLRALTGSPKSRAELERTLRRKGCPDDVAAEVLDRMEHVGLVDDEAYAQMFVRSKRTGRGLARRALQHELRAKGVDDETASGVLAQIGVDDERDVARELVAKKLRSMHGLERVVQTRRLAGMLARKGYSSEISRQVIAESLDALPEHQRD